MMKTDRLVILDSYDEFNISDVLEELTDFLSLIGFNVKVVEQYSDDICNYIENEEYRLQYHIFNKIIKFNNYMEELEEDENLIIILKGCFFHRFDSVFKKSNPKEFILKEAKKFYDEDYLNEFCNIFSLKKEKPFINKETIHRFSDIFLSNIFFFLPEHRKDIFKLTGRIDVLPYNEDRNTVIINCDMSSKGKLLILLRRICETKNFFFNMIKVKIKENLDVDLINDLSTLYSYEQHGKILSICRDLDKPLNREKCISTINMGHLSPLQFFHFTFKLKGIPRTVLIELERYRTINAMCCESTRYVLKKMKNPEDKIYKGVNSIAKEIAVDSLNKIKEHLNNGNITADEIKLALPEGFSTNLYMKIDCRNISHLFKERLSRGTHKDFRILVYMMIFRIIEKNGSYLDILSLLV